MNTKKGGPLARISATVVALMMLLFGSISVAYGLGGDGDGVDETLVIPAKMDEGSTTPPSKSPSPRPTPPRPAPGSGEDVREDPPVCSPEGGGSIALYTTPWTFDWVFDEDQWQWVETPKEFGETVVSSWPATEGECPTPEPSPTPTPTPTEDPDPEPSEEPEPGDLPVTSDLNVTCIDGGARISMHNTNDKWHSTTIVGWFDDDGVEHPLNYETDVAPGGTDYVSTTAVPKGSKIGYTIVWSDGVYGEEGRSYQTPAGRLLCGSAGGDPSPTPTPTKPVDPTPSPSPTETVKPSPEPTVPEPTASATPTPTPAPTQEPTKPGTPESSPTTEPTKAPSEQPTAEPTSDKGGGSKDGDKDKGKKGTKPRLPKSGVSDDDPIVAIVGATVLAAAVSAGGLVAWRRRRAS